MPTGLAATAEILHPPKLAEIGTDLLQLTRWQAARAIALPFLAFAAYWVFAATDHWVLAVASTVVLSFVTYGSTSHDLVHGSLGLPRRLNKLLLAVIEALSLRSGHAYRAAHLHHHARFPHDDDIEAEASRMSLFRTLWEGVIFQFRIYRWGLKHSRTDWNWILAEGIAVVMFVVASALASFWTIVPIMYVALMIAGSWIIPLITSYIPHDAAAADPLHQTRLYRGWIARLVAFDHLCHLEHHLYPAVPHQNWARLARRLDPWFQSVGIEPVRVGFALSNRPGQEQSEMKHVS